VGGVGGGEGVYVWGAFVQSALEQQESHSSSYIAFYLYLYLLLFSNSIRALQH